MADGTETKTTVTNASAEAAASAAQSPRLPSLRLLVILIVVLPIAAVAAVLVGISIVTSRGIAEQLAQELVAGATNRVAAEVRRYLGDAVRVSDLYTRRIATGKLSPADLASWEQIMFDDLATSPNVASICIGNPQGDATYLQRAHGRIEFGISDGAKDCAAIECPADLSGKIDWDHPIRKYRYDPRARPWYKAAIEHGQPIWTPVYFWFGDGGSASETGAGYTRVVRKGQDVAGVVVIDVTLSALSDFLRRQSFSASGSIFIVDSDGLLVAASDGAVNSSDGKRLALANSDSATARELAHRYPTTDASTRPTGPSFVGRMIVGDQPVRVSHESLRPYPGMEWQIVTVLPEATFLAPARSMERRSILLAGLAVAGGGILGIFSSRRLTEPLLKLTRHAARIGDGDFDARLQLGGAKELSQLADETNRMAGGLRQRLELEKSLELATHVQQSLLPQSTPEIAGLDVAAHSKYCDSTGGDYYDFIDVAGLPQDRVFIAIGDVMGHGIGSALLMATARAAVRTSAVSGTLTLGELMARVNDVLSSDPHGQFMTLALIIVEPKHGRIRWASAGHDPVIAYNPSTDQFREFEGADIPLGVIGGHVFGNFHDEGLADGWVLVAGTDGVWEARDESREMYGKDRLRDVIRANATKTSKDIVAAVEQSLTDFVGRQPIVDDITFVVIKMLDRPVDRLAD